MKVFDVNANIAFGDANPHAEPLLVEHDGRILRFALRPGQSIREHRAPSSPVYIFVLAGHGLFSGGAGQAERHGAGALLVFAAGEPHAVTAEDGELVFLAFLHGALQVG